MGGQGGLEEGLQMVASNRRMQSKPVRIIDPVFQELMVCVFAMKMGMWDKEIGMMINKVIKDGSVSSKLKSVLLYYFYDNIHLPTEVQAA